MIYCFRNIKTSYIGRRVAIVALFFISLILPNFSWGLYQEPAFFDKYNFLNPDQIDKKYNSSGIGLKGSVYEIVGYSINPTYKFGEIVDENKKEIYRYIFDENGNLSERYGDYNHTGISRYIPVRSLQNDPVGSVRHSMNDKEEVKPDVIYRVYNDSVIIESKYSATKEFYKRDETGRITEVYICNYSYGNLKNEQKIKISYNENGYSGEFWESPTHKTVFTRTGNSFYYDPNTDWTFDKVNLTLDKDGRVIEDNRQEYKFSYNKNGDLISATRSYPNTNNKYGGSLIEIDEWEYVYDDKGNWIERKGHNAYTGTKVWERRDIKYLSPQQIQNLNDLKRFQEEEILNLNKEINNQLREHAKEEFLSAKEPLFSDKGVKLTDDYVSIDDDTSIYEDVDIPAEFPGGEMALTNWINWNVRYPEGALQNGKRGNVKVKWIVEKDGTISNVEIEKGIDKDLDAEAIRVIKKMPRWRPAYKDGQPVKSNYSTIIHFNIK